MIKRTPQEWADITGCYVVQDSTGYWFVYENRPIPSAIYKLWNCSTGGRFCILSSLIDVPAGHHWTHLYEPSAKSSEISRNKQDVAPHQSEVFIHKEYKVICADNLEKLQDKVTLAINEGWNCQGGVYVQDRSHIAHVEFAFFYQAMVRGV